MSWDKKVQTLTPTEKRVFDIMVKGKTTKEIADELCLHFSTIKNHRTSILKKLGARDSKEVIVWFYEDKIKKLTNR